MIEHRDNARTLTELYENEYDLLVHYAWTHSGLPAVEDAEDLASDFFSRIVRCGISATLGTATAESLMFHFKRSLVDEARKRKTTKRGGNLARYGNDVSDLCFLPTGGCSPDANAEVSDLQRVFQERAHLLPARERIILKRLLDCATCNATPREIADSFTPDELEVFCAASTKCRKLWAEISRRRCDLRKKILDWV